MNNSFIFFRESPLYKELRLLNILSEDSLDDLKANKSIITQREIAALLDISVSQTNDLLESLVCSELLTKNIISSKSVIYNLTNKGIERRKLLNIELLKSSLNVFNTAKLKVLEILNDLLNNNKYQNKSFLFYGAGEIAELLLQVIKISNYDLTLLAVIDDNNNLIGKSVMDYPIISINDVDNYHYDYIMISSYNHREEIRKHLFDSDIDKTKIINFFE